MTEVMLDTAEEEFLKHNTVSAYKWATLAQQLDPFFTSVDQYAEGYRIHMAAFKKLYPAGERDWYAILGIQQRSFDSISCDAITHKFVKLAKMINPDVHSSAAAPRAFKLLTTAWENLGDPDKRRAYHSRVGLPLPKSEKTTLEIASQPISEKPLKTTSQKSCRDKPKSSGRGVSRHLHCLVKPTSPNVGGRATRHMVI